MVTIPVAALSAVLIGVIPFCWILAFHACLFQLILFSQILQHTYLV